MNNFFIQIFSGHPYLLIASMHDPSIASPDSDTNLCPLDLTSCGWISGLHSNPRKPKMPHHHGSDTILKEANTTEDTLQSWF